MERERGVGEAYYVQVHCLLLAVLPGLQLRKPIVLSLRHISPLTEFHFE